MERFNLEYTKKNIPIPSKQEYELLIVAKTEALIKRMRWKAMLELGLLQPSDKKTFGFRTRNCPPVVKEMKDFEIGLWNLVNNIEFRHTTNDFQDRMKQDIRNIKQSGQLVVSADKSTNLYKMDKDEYTNHLQNNITRAYKKANPATQETINKEAYKIAKKLDLDDRMQCLQTSEAYITVKDHKEGFPANPSFRLINPSKTDIGRVSKAVLDRINQDLLGKIKVNQWKSDKEVVGWFKGITEKHNYTFIKFDIDNFYPSITLELFNKAIAYAKRHVDISDEDLEIIMQARKTLLFNKEEPWTKRNNSDDFDVPMGSYDGAEVCELIGAFMLNELSNIIDKKHIGLYRDDGLGIMGRIGGPEIERRKKKIIQTFKKHKLDITVLTNLKGVDYLDIEFSLANDMYKPYRKPNSDLLYVNKKSNHPPCVLKQIPKGISKRLSEISSSEEIFKAAIPQYEEALKRSGFNEKLVYTNDEDPNAQRRPRRTRKVIWYNPPFSLSVKTNIGKEFLKLLCTHFHRRHRFHKIFNKNTVKLSYSCTRNVSSIISGLNKGILKPTPPQERDCNCRNREQCPLDNKCLTPNIVYEAEVTSHPDEVVNDYRGLCSTTWKDRYAVHNQGFNHKKYSKGCELAKHIWSLKDSQKTFSLKWSILQRVRGRLVGGECKLCVTETMLINKHPNKERLLNKNSIQKCRHENKYLLSRYKSSSRTNDRDNPG